jgi:hypothetical protein
MVVENEASCADAVLDEAVVVRRESIEREARS